MLAQHPMRVLRYGYGYDRWQSPMVQRCRLCSNVSTNEGSVTYLRSAKTGMELYLVGTAHISAKSAEEVNQVINEVRPGTIAVELCEERARKLMAGESNETQSFLKSIFDFFRSPGGLGQKAINYAFKSIYAMLRNTGMEPGKEFKVACEQADRLGADLLYIDRDYKVTIRRLADVITYQDVFKLFTSEADMPPELQQQFQSGDLEETVERLKTRKNVRANLKFMEAVFPKLVAVMIHERDKLMVERLQKCNGKVVGVVGMAHMDGIERLWKESEM